MGITGSAIQKSGMAILFALASTALPGADLDNVCTSAPQTHTEEIAGGGGTYAIHMGGRIDGAATRDPVGYWGFEQYWEPNVSVRLENIGEVPLKNPWLRRKDMPDTRTLQSIVDSIITPGVSDREKARRIWEFEIRNRFHATSQDAEVQDAVKRFNAYGYTLCYDESRVISDLWRAAGLKVRKGYPSGHSTAEVFYDGAWHLLDSDESIICLLRDNQTIASEAQIAADHDLMKRTHNYGPLHDADRVRDESNASLYWYDGERTGEQPGVTRHTMAFTLRPGEAITWSWKHGGRYHGKEFSCCGEGNDAWIAHWRLPDRIVNGELSYAPDLTKAATLHDVEAQGLELRQDGAWGPGLYAARPASSLVVPVESAYPVVGGNLTLDLRRSDMNRQSVAASVSFDGGATWQKAGSTYQGDYSRWRISLDALFPPAADARYSYLLRLDFANTAANPALCLKGFRLVSTLQMAELSLPGVALGDNPFVYANETGARAKVRITHTWSECGAAELPGRPEVAISPRAGGAASGTKVHFEWAPPASGATPVDYQFQLSEFPDLRWALSPNFNRLVQRSGTPSINSFDTPYVGLINPGQTYYWRVRARSEQGVWGPWSPVFPFSALAPAVPVNVAGRFDAASRSMSLSWEPGENGTKPARYRVYGSAERGFTASDSAYEYNAGRAGVKKAAANLLLETKADARSVELPLALWRPYYRVVAIDAEGRQSGPSNLAEVQHLLILTTAIPAAQAGSYYEAKIEAAASIGHLTYLADDHAAFRDGDDLSFTLAGAPQGLTISPDNGTLSGFLPAGSAGTYEFTVSVSNPRTGGKDSVKLILQVHGA